MHCATSAVADGSPQRCGFQLSWLTDTVRRERNTPTTRPTTTGKPTAAPFLHAASTACLGNFRNRLMTHTIFPRIETPRLLLDSLRTDDAAALFACRGDPEVARYQGWQPQSMDEAADFITRQASVAFGQADSWCQLAIRLRDSTTLVGDFGIHFPASTDEAVELGISLMPTQQRKGHGRIE